MIALVRGGLVALAVVSTSAPGPALVSREVYLMGTRATLSTWDADRGAGLRRLEKLLAPLEATEAQLSTWRPDSEVSRLNAAAGQPASLSRSLCALVEQLDYWVDATEGAFDPAIGALIAAWDIHGTGRVPRPDERHAAVERSGWRRVRFDGGTCTLTLPAGVSLDVGAFGKGEGLDRARAALASDTSPWMIDLGGQVMVQAAPPGAKAWEVALAHPARRDEPVRRLAMVGGSLATTAGSERDLRAGSTRIGHVLDPRTGRPAPFGGSVVVWHESAFVADVLSTALYVMGPDPGIRWAEARGIAACYLLTDAGGRVVARPSAAFASRFRAS